MGPELLNFVSFGNLTVTFDSGNTRTCNDLRLGQGHAFLYNNWWLAGKDCRLTYGTVWLTCKSCGLAFSSCTIDGHEFEVFDLLNNETPAPPKWRPFVAV